MKSSNRLALTGVVLGLLPLAAQAANTGSAGGMDDRIGWFAGVGAGSAQLDISEGPSTGLTYIYLQGGWRFSRYFSVDARIGTGSSSLLDIEDPFDELAISGVDFKLDSLYGVYARAILPVGDHWDLYAQVGYTSATLKGTVNDGTGKISGTDSADSLSYGLGASWLITPRFILDLEYQPVLVDGSLWKTDSLNLAFRMRF